MLPNQNVRTIDFSQPLKTKDKILLNSILNQNPDIIYFETDTEFVVNGVKIKFSHPLLKREKDLFSEEDDSLYPQTKPYKQTKYDVLNKTPIGQGVSGVVHETIKNITISDDEDEWLREEEDTAHIVKIMKGTEDIGLVQQERDFQAIGDRFHPKPLQINRNEDDKRFLTSRRFKGQTLQSIIGNNTLSDDQKYLLSIALLRALQEQVFQLGLLHRDIKPANIIVNLETMEVNIIDLGFAISKNKKICEWCGTPDFMAPEIYDRKKMHYYTQQADIFSMGIVLAELWGNKEPGFNNKQDPQNGNELRNLLDNRRANAHNITDAKTHPQVAELIKTMTSDVGTDRGEIGKHISDLTLAYYENDTTKSSCFNEGVQLRKDIQKKELTFKAIPKRPPYPFIKELNHAIEKIPEDQQSIDAFIHGLGYQSLKGKKNKTELRRGFISILSSHQDEKDKYQILLEKYDPKPLQQKLDPVKRKQLQQLRDEIYTKFKRFEERPFDLDRLDSFNKKLSSKYYSIAIRFISITSTSNDEFINGMNQFLSDINLKDYSPIAKMIFPSFDFEPQIITQNQLINHLKKITSKHTTLIQNYEKLLSTKLIRPHQHNRVERYKQIAYQFDLNAMNNIDKREERLSLLGNILQDFQNFNTGPDQPEGLANLIKLAKNAQNDPLIVQAMIEECQFQCGHFQALKLGNFTSLMQNRLFSSNLFSCLPGARDPGLNLLYRALAEYYDNILFDKNIKTLEELLIAQQKREVIEEIEEEIKRLSWDESLISEKLPGLYRSSDFKIDAYYALMFAIKKSPSGKSIQDLLVPQNLETIFVKDINGTDRYVIEEGKARKPLNVSDALSYIRGAGFRATTSAKKLDELRNLPKPSDILGKLKKPHQDQVGVITHLGS